MAETTQDAATLPSSSGPGMVSELKVSGHLMRLEPGLFCIVQTPSKAASVADGLPGVRVSPAPGMLARPEVLHICSFRPDGWLSATGDAALVRVSGVAQHLMVTIYQAANAPEAAPDIQVLRLLEGPLPSAGAIGAPQRTETTTHPAPVPVEMLAHIQAQGDTGGYFGDWLGTVGSKRWIEGFALAPIKVIAADDIEYQAVLGRGWSSPWVEGGQFCGSRGMALPILGLRVRLRGTASETMTCSYAASFVDGALIGPVEEGQACEAQSLAAIEALVIAIHPKGEASGIEMPDAIDSDAKPARRKPGRKKTDAELA